MAPTTRGGEKQPRPEASELTGIVGEAGAVQLPAVELQADDGEHQDGEEEQEADLQEGHHGLHDGLQHDLQAWEGAGRTHGAPLSPVPRSGCPLPSRTRRRAGTPRREKTRWP